ncbi:MAG: cysteine hydrolase family protein [Parvibaculaceae bacterium]|nr:cysteine hydrolase family protein [Parvibaculaceae bacterium]
MARQALILVDLQNDYFAGGRFPLVGIDDAAANAARLLDAARKAGDLVVHVQHQESAPDAPFFVADSPGAEINPAVSVSEGEPVVVKENISAFRDTDLKAILDRHGITDVRIAGAMSHMCIDAVTRAAADLGFGATVVHDAVATVDLEFNGVTVPARQVHAAFMAALAFGYASVLSTDEVLAEKKAGGRRA